MNRKTKYILIVDDDPAILAAITYTLEDAGYEIKTTVKGEYAEALREVKGGLPALIILDVLLSGKDGREICKLLKSHRFTKHIPIIMISAHPDAEISVKKVGADDFLAKPFEVQDLLNKVRRCIS